MIQQDPIVSIHERGKQGRVKYNGLCRGLCGERGGERGNQGASAKIGEDLPSKNRDVKEEKASTHSGGRFF